MKRGSENYIIATLVVVGFLFIFLLINSSPTGKVIEEHPLPQDCSEESIKELWEFVFNGSSDNLQYVSYYNESNQTQMEELEAYYELFGCPLYTIYQVNGNEIRILYGANVWFFVGINTITGYVGEFTLAGLQNITETLNSGDMEQIVILMDQDYGLIFDDSFIQAYSKPRNIQDTSQAKIRFSSIFNISNENWFGNGSGEEGDFKFYGFSENKTLENITLFGESINPEGMVLKGGLLLQNHTIDFYSFTKMSTFTEALYKEYEGWTSIINTTIENITIKANDSRVNAEEEIAMFSTSRSGVQKVEILQNNKPIVETKINFSNVSVDWTEIVLRKQPPTYEVGYIIINGINESKNVTVDKLSPKSEEVCIKSGEVNSIYEISEDCDAQEEYLLDCPGTGNGFTCEIINNTFYVTGLMHSAVLEFLESEPCFPQWNCNTWSNSKEQCGYRSCFDLNKCGNTTGLPEEYKKCPPVCIPNWDCTDWEPEKCPKEEEFTRNCEDLNDCGKDNEMPKTSQSCEYENNTLLWVLLGGSVVLLGLALFFGLRNPRKHKPLQDQTHNPHPDDELEEHELPTQGNFSEEDAYAQENFNEFKENPIFQEQITKPTPAIQKQKKQLPKQHELPKKIKEDLKPKEKGPFHPKNRGEFYLP